MKTKQKKNIAILAISFLAVIGTYNAVMINSGSVLSNSMNISHLDNVKGSRTLAVSNTWTKLGNQTEVKALAQTVIAETPAVVTVDAVAAIQASLSMKLVEVTKKGESAKEFSGAIETNNGIIESLNAALPGDVKIDISFSEMVGNTFEYDLNGEIYTGMMYQVDQASYMITMTNGPLEGTRLKFAGETPDIASQAQYLAETHNVEVQNFGTQTEAPEVFESETPAAQTAEAPSINFNI